MSDNLKGSLLMMAAMALFAIEDMFIKLLAKSVPTGQIVFVLGAAGAPVFIAMAWRQGAGIFIRGALQPAVIARNIGEIIGTLGFIIALANLPIALVLAVFQAMPLVVTMGAALLLGESVGWRRWSAIALGFAGVLIVIRPGGTAFDPMTLWLILGVFGLGGRDLVTRVIPKRFSNAQISAWGLIAVAILGLGMMAQGGAVVVSMREAGLLLGGVIFGTAGYLAVTTAARVGDVGAVAPFRYIRLVFAMMIGNAVLTKFPMAQP